MSLLDTASLLLTPNAYKEGKLYSIIPENGDGDFTFTRATTATRVNSAGLVELVPYNLLKYSEQFDNAAWTKNASSVTADSVISPSGVIDADTLTANGTSSVHQAGQLVSVTSGTTYTWSVYANKNTNDFIQLTASGAIFGVNVWANFDLNNGVVGSVGSSATASIQSVGNGWYRCIITGAATTTASGTVSANIVTSSTSPRAETNTLNTSVYLWGAQLVEGTNALPYQKTETRLNIPRIDYSLGGCPNILLEPQRTNLLLQSSSFDSASWTKLGSAITSNTTTAPDNTLTADTLTETAITNVHEVYRTPSPASIGTNTISVYVKNAIGSRFLNVSASTSATDYVSVRFSPSTETLSSVVVSGAYSSASASFVTLLNGWYRVSLTFTSSVLPVPQFALSTDGLNSSVSLFGVQSYTGDGTSGIYLWGAQLEAGAYATSYIPTTSASVTRNADVLNLNDLQNKNILSSDWTIYSEFIDYGNSSNNGVFILGLKNITQTDWIGLYRPSGGALTLSKKENNGSVSTTASLIQVTNGNIIKASIKCTSNNLKVYINGSLAYTSAFANPSLMTNFELARIGATFNTTLVKSALAFNVALTDDQLIELTTI